MCNMRDTRLFVLYLYFMLCRFANCVQSRAGACRGRCEGRGRAQQGVAEIAKIFCARHGNEKNTFWPLAMGASCLRSFLLPVPSLYPPSTSPQLPLLLQFVCLNIICAQLQIWLTAAVSVCRSCSTAGILTNLQAWPEGRGRGR